MSKEIEQITDYNTNLELLIQQYKDKTNFVGILQADNSQADDLETAIFEVRDYFWLDTAEGDQLDVLGAIQGEERLGRTDTDYRAAIKARVIINTGSGEPETVISTVKDIYGATTVMVSNIGSATFQVWADISLTYEQFLKLEKIIPAGVQLILVSGSTNPFVFYDDPDGSGFSKLNDDVPFLDTAGDTILDTAGDNIIVTVNESDPDFGGELQGVWQSGA